MGLISDFFDYLDEKDRKEWEIEDAKIKSVNITKHTDIYAVYEDGKLKQKIIMKDGDPKLPEFNKRFHKLMEYYGLNDILKEIEDDKDIYNHDVENIKTVNGWIDPETGYTTIEW